VEVMLVQLELMYDNNFEKYIKAKQSRYMPWWRLGGEEV
jgi:hypothetical protein